MNWLAFVRVISIVCTGLAAGVFLGHGMGVAFAGPQLSASSFVQLQQIIHTQFVPMMPILLAGAAGTSILWAYLIRASRGFDLWFVLFAATAMVATFVLTRVVNVPINEQLMTWSVQAPPVNLTELWQPWQRAHSIRTVLALLAFVLLASAASTFVPDRRQPIYP